MGPQAIRQRRFGLSPAGDEQQVERKGADAGWRRIRCQDPGLGGDEVAAPLETGMALDERPQAFAGVAG